MTLVIKSMARSDVIASRWDKDLNVGFMTFKCRTCGHEWEWKALHEQKPVKGKPYGQGAWALYSRYWSVRGGGVKTKCPKCGAGDGKQR